MNRVIARAYDYFVVVPARMYFNDDFRSKYYGMFGVYRDTSYGVECRALGGFFTEDRFLGWVYDNTIKAMEFCAIEENIDKLMSIDSPDMSEMDSVMKYYKTLGVDVDSLLIKEEEYAVN